MRKIYFLFIAVVLIILGAYFFISSGQGSKGKFELKKTPELTPAGSASNECSGKTLMTEPEFLQAYEMAKNEASQKRKDMRLQSLSLLELKSANFIFKSYPQGDLVVSFYYYQNKKDNSRTSEGDAGGWGSFKPLALESYEISPHKAFAIGLVNGGNKYCQKYLKESSLIRLQWFETKEPQYEVSFGDGSSEKFLEFKINPNTGEIIEKIDQDNR